MKFISIDTATEACSAALYVDGSLREKYAVVPRGHGQRILPMIDSLLGEAGLRPADLDAVAFGRGPGAFTGVRIAAGVAQAIAFAARLPVIGVSDLAAVACAAGRLHGARRTLVCLDARMGEVYWAHYDCDGDDCRLDGEERLDAPGEVTADQAVFAAGPGWSAYPEMGKRLASQLAGSDASLLPRAADIARLAAARIARGETVSAEQALPVYLRQEVAWKKA